MCTGRVGRVDELAAAELQRLAERQAAAEPVSTAARTALARLQSDHAGAPVLIAICQRLCLDIDRTDNVGQRIAATRQVVALLNVLDGALFASTRLPDGPGDDGAPDPEGGTDPDDIFEIGDVPPGMGDATS